LSLNVAVDFERRKLTGSVEYKLQIIKDGVDHFYLDMKGIDVSRVDLLFVHEREHLWTEIEYEIHEPNPDIGQALLILIPEPIAIKNTINVRVFYSTNENSTAINWLTADQTAVKKLPFMYT